MPAPPGSKHLVIQLLNDLHTPHGPAAAQEFLRHPGWGGSSQCGALTELADAANTDGDFDTYTLAGAVLAARGAAPRKMLDRLRDGTVDLMLSEDQALVEYQLTAGWQLIAAPFAGPAGGFTASWFEMLGTALLARAAGRAVADRRADRDEADRAVALAYQRWVPRVAMSQPGPAPAETVDGFVRHMEDRLAGALAEGR